MNQSVCDPTAAVWIVSECNTPEVNDTPCLYKSLNKSEA